MRNLARYCRERTRRSPFPKSIPGPDDDNENDSDNDYDNDNDNDNDNNNNDNDNDNNNDKTDIRASKELQAAGCCWGNWDRTCVLPQDLDRNNNGKIRENENKKQEYDSVGGGEGCSCWILNDTRVPR